MTIRLKLFLSFIGLALLPLVLMSWLFYDGMKNAFLSDIKTRLVRLASVQRDRLQSNVEADTLTVDRITLITSVFSDFLGRTGETFIFQPDGKGGVTFVVPRRFGTDPASPDITAIGLSKSDVFSEDLVDSFGKHVLVTSAYLPSKDWSVVVKIDRDEVLSPLSALFSVLLLSLIFFVLAIIFISLLVTESILNPVRQLTDTTQAISMGDLHATVDPETLAAKDELGDLGRAFDRTLVSLKLAMLQPAPEEKPSIDAKAPNRNGNLGS